MYTAIQSYMIPWCQIQEYNTIDTNGDGIKEKMYTTIQTVRYFWPRDLSYKEQSHFATIDWVKKEVWKVYLEDISQLSDKSKVIINTREYEVLKIYAVRDPQENIHHYKVYVSLWKK